MDSTAQVERLLVQRLLTVEKSTSQNILGLEWVPMQTNTELKEGAWYVEFHEPAMSKLSKMQKIA